MRFRASCTKHNNGVHRQASSQFGDPKNPSILFIHGIRLGREIWTPHAQLLAPRYHVVTLDLPGHGELARVPFTQANVAALLDRTIDELCTKPPLIVGYSLGEFVAMQYAPSHADRTAGLVLADCTLEFEGWKHWPYEAGARLAELMPAPWFDALTNLSLHVTLPSAWADRVRRIPFNREVIASTRRLASGTHYCREIAEYKKPVLFLNGEFDLVFRMDERRYLQAVPQARLRIIRRTDHTGPIRRPQEFAAAVSDFAGHVFIQTAS